MTNQFPMPNAPAAPCPTHGSASGYGVAGLKARHSPAWGEASGWKTWNEPSPVGAKLVGAFTRIELLSSILLCLLLLFAGFSFLTMHRSATQKALKNQCEKQLKGMSLGFRAFANDNESPEQRNGVFPMQVPLEKLALTQSTQAPLSVIYFRAASNELAAPPVLQCPSDNGRQRCTDWQLLSPTNISYFLSLDARPDAPEAVLFGDRNLDSVPPRGGSQLKLHKATTVAWTRTLHDGCGQFALADGSVKHVCFSYHSPDVFAKSLVTLKTNRLEFP